MTSPVKEILRHRSLIRFLATKRNRVSISKTILGRAWIVLMPVSQLAIYYFLVAIVFQRSQYGELDASIVLMTGIVHYFFLSQAMSRSCWAIMSNRGVLLQVPLEPIVFTAVSFYQQIENFIVLLLVYAAFYLWFGPDLTARIAVYPLLLLVLMVLSWSWAMILSTLTIFIRDLKQFTAIGLRLMMYLCPVLYLASHIEQSRDRFPWLAAVYLYNPFACYFSLVQWALLGQPAPPPGPFLSFVVFLLLSVVAANVLYARTRHRITKAF